MLRFSEMSETAEKREIFMRHECWQLQDFITPLGDSLAYVCSLPQP